MAETATYTGRDIQVLEGLEPVRKRPGMYIGGTGKAGLHHLLWELVDNAVDEATNGFASQIEVVLHADGKSCTVTDNGRGIPVDKHPTKKVPALQVIMTTLHSGGKFDNSNYITSGGLHGVGASVVNALSSEMVATVRRDGATWVQKYARGEVVTKLSRRKGETRGTGTSIYFVPDQDIFKQTHFDSELIAERLEVKTYLNAGLKVVFKDEQAGTRKTYQHDGGIAEYLTHIIDGAKARRVHTDQFFVRQDEFEEGCRVEVALQWTEAPKEMIRSYVNGIPTPGGGTHETGFKDAVGRAVRSYIETHGLVDRKLDVSSDDIREGLYAVVNVFMLDPQFQGQTKEKLNNPEVRTVVAGAFRTELLNYLNTHPTTGEAIVARVIQAAKARLASRAAARQARRKTSLSHRLNLPGKLADCSSTDPGESELFIVEGDSAGGSAKQGRNRKTQAILPLRGKVLNAEQASKRRVSDNRELMDIVQALGCGYGDHLDLKNLRYHKVVLLMDADSDGHHIATLLLTFIYRYLRPLIDEGHVYIAQPPLFRIDAGTETHWALDEADRVRIEKKIKRTKPNARIDVQRFKGLGEMMPKTLWQTTLDPDHRRLLKVAIPDDERLLTEQTISDLMGKNAGARYDFIMDHAAEVTELDV